MARFDRRRTIAALATALVGIALAQGGTIVSAAPPILRSASVGVAGEWKLGATAEIALQFEADEPFAGTFGIEVPDGDGVRVERLSPIEIAQGTTTVREPIRVGRAVGAVRVRLYPSDLATSPAAEQAQIEAVLPFVDAATWRKKANPLALPAPRPAQQSLTIGFGPETGTEEALRSLRARGRTDESRVYARVESLLALPHAGWGLDGVDMVVLAPGDGGEIDKVAPEQWAALVEWTELGGSVVFVGGPSSEALLGQGKPLAALAPGRFDRLERLSRVRGVETLAAVEEPLATIDDRTGAPLTVATAFFLDVEGTVVSFEGALPKSGATIVRYPVRFGETTYVAFDLSRPPFAGWAGREALWREMLARGRRDDDATVRDATAGRATHLGYDDLSGQLRTTLERFDGVQIPSFLAIVLVLVLYLAWIGPGDWFFLKRIGRMEWTWLTFALVLVGLSTGIVMAAGYLRGTTSRWNQLDLADVHVDSRGRALVRGHSWSVAYSDAGRKYDLRPSAATLDAAGQGTPDVAFSWEGLAGGGVGAMSGAGGATLPLPAYRLAPTEGEGTSIQGVPIQVSSTKAFVGRWTERFETKPPGTLFRSPIDDLLRGDATNPLPVALQDVRIISGSWIYSLHGDLAPGETWTLDELDSPMNLEWRLKRRRTVAGNDEASERWDASRAPVDRLVEMLMFHRAAGGRSYTGDLRHDHYPRLDFSDRLEFPGAMLIGRIERPLVDVAAEPAVFGDSDRVSSAWVRIVLPVAPVDPVTGRPIVAPPSESDVEVAPSPDAPRSSRGNQSAEAFR